MAQRHRYFVISPNGRMVTGFDRLEAAETVAREYGEGAFLVDTLAKNYQPMLQTVLEGELVIAGVSGWDTGKPGGLDRDLIQAVKTGKAPVVQAFLAKGANPNAVDEKGGSALHWAAGGGKEEICRLLLAAGADPTVTDALGQTPLDVAKKRGARALIALLEKV